MIYIFTYTYYDKSVKKHRCVDFLLDFIINITSSIATFINIFIYINFFFTYSLLFYNYYITLILWFWSALDYSMLIINYCGCYSVVEFQASGGDVTEGFSTSFPMSQPVVSGNIPLVVYLLRALFSGHISYLIGYFIEALLL